MSPQPPEECPQLICHSDKHPGVDEEENVVQNNHSTEQIQSFPKFFPV